ncbi:MAG: hypothetical protein ACRCUE_13240, partial [Bosea sp. (in: a-proteobacteria)]
KHAQGDLATVGDEDGWQGDGDVGHGKVIARNFALSRGVDARALCGLASSQTPPCTPALLHTRWCFG